MKTKVNEVMDLKNPLDTIKGSELSIKSIDIEDALQWIENEAISGEKVDKIIKQTPELISVANNLKVISDQSMADSKKIQDNIDVMVEIIRAEYKEFRHKTFQLGKRTKTLEDKHIDPLKKAKQNLMDKNSNYYNEKEKQRQDLQRKEEDRIFKEELKRRKELEGQRQKAIKNGNMGKVEEKNRKIEELSNMPEFIPPDLPDKIKSEGVVIGFKFVYDVSIKDPKRFLSAIADGEVELMHAIDFNMSKISKYCKDNDYSGFRVPGLYVRKLRSQK